MTGLSSEDMLGRGDNAYSTPFWGEPKQELVDCIMNNNPYSDLPHDSIEKHGDSLIAETFLPVFNGGKGIFVWLKASPLYDSNGNILGAIQAIRDITDRKLAEEALVESEAFFNRIIEQSPFPTWISDAKGTMIRANPALKKVLNLSDEQLIGKYNAFEDKQIEPDILKVLHDALQKGKTTDYELDWIGEKTGIDGIQEGNRVYCEGTMFPIHNQKGRITNAVITYKDSTDKKRAEEALLESEEKYRLAMDATTDGLWDWNVESGEVYYSPSWLKILGEKEVPPKYESWMNRIYPNDKETVLSTLQDHLDGKSEYWQKEHRLSTKTGKWKWVLGRGCVVKVSENGQPLRMVGTMTDITERKRLERQLQQTRKMQSIGTLAGGIAHDFNNILTPIVGYTEMLMEDLPPDSPFRNYSNEIYKSALRARALVKQILTFSRHEKHETKPMRMQPILKETIKMVRSTIPSSIELMQDIDGKCGIINADPTHIHQMIMNLLTNAYHAVGDGIGKITVELKDVELTALELFNPHMTPGTYNCLTISDTGSGMDDETKSWVFEPFFTTKELGKGTGMGLSVVHGIVETLNGGIKILSEVGKGTKFSVYIPLAKDAVDISKPQTEEAVPGGTESILIVDDEKAILQMENMMLQRLGYRIRSCDNSIDALEIFRSAPDNFDLIITDMAMPNMPGDKLAVELLKIRSDIPILLCTGYSEKINSDNAMIIGIRGFLTKPIVKKAFAQKLREVLDNGNSAFRSV